MPNTQVVTLESASLLAEKQKLALAASKYRLFKAGLVVTPQTTRAELLAAECDFDDYTPGGETLAAWTGPATPPEGGAVITSPLVNIICAAPQVTPNDVGGFWIETAAVVGPPAYPETVHVAGNFDEPIQMAATGDAITRVVQDVYGRA